MPQTASSASVRSGKTTYAGIDSARAISLGALASGSAVLCAPAALAAVSASVDLRTAFLITLPLLAMLVLLPPRGRGPARASVPRG